MSRHRPEGKGDRRDSADSSGHDGGPAPPAAGRRLLVVSASMGAGHDAVAAELAHRLAARGYATTRADVLDLLPGGTGAAVRSFYRTTIRSLPALYAALYAVFFRGRGGPRPGSAPLAALAEDRLLALVDREDPHAVVPVFHLAAQLTGRLRARGALRVPTAVMITDFAVHRQWLHPGNDLNLCLTAQAAAEARVAVDRPALVTGPVVADAFSAPAPGAPAWRRRFRATGHCGPAVLLSAGAWGVGTRLAATARALDRAGYLPVVLCGHDERLRRTLSRRPGTLALGWVRDMPGLMAACRALVDNAAGQTAVQALAAGLPVVGYRPIPGHGAAGVHRMAAAGLTDYAPDERNLIASLAALTVPGPDRDRRIAAGRTAFTADAAAYVAAVARPPLDDDGDVAR